MDYFDTSFQVANIPGFVGNRCIFVYIMESMLLLEGNDDDNNYNNYSNNSNMSINTTTANDMNTAIDDDLIAIGGLSIQRIDEAIR